MDQDLSPSQFKYNLYEHGFAMIPMAIMRDTNLSSGAKVTFGMLSFYTFRYHGVPGQKDLGVEMGVDERTIRRHMVELEEKAYIERERVGLGHPDKIIVVGPQICPHEPDIFVQGEPDNYVRSHKVVSRESSSKGLEEKAKDSSEITGYGPVTSDCPLDPVAEKKRLKAEKAAQDVARMKVQKADLQEVLDCMTDEHRALWDRMVVGMQDTLHDGKPLSFAKELGQAMIHRAQLAKCGLECWLDCCEISCEKGVFTAEFARGCVKNWKPGRGSGNGYAGGNGRGVDSNYQAGNAPPRDPSQPETFERAYARVVGPMPEVTEDNPWGAAMWEKEMWLWAEREYGYEKSHAEYDRRGFGIEYPRQ